MQVSAKVYFSETLALIQLIVHEIEIGMLLEKFYQLVNFSF